MSLEVGEPDIGFQAGFGFYLGLVASGIAAVAGLLAGATTATVLGVLPSTVTAVAIVGHILARRAHGLPERIGGSRRRRAACYLPPVAFAASLVAPAVAPIDRSATFVVTGVLTVLTGLAAFGVDRMSRNRYIDAATADDPATTWTWHGTGFGHGGTLFTAAMAVMILAGLATAAAWGSVYGLFMAVYGTVLLCSNRFDWGGKWNDFDPEEQWNPPEIRAHEAGIVLERPHAKKLVPWTDIEAVRLTDDELVLERRWLDIRCDRSAIDDPEAVLEDLERVRERADPERRPELAD